MIPVTNDRLGRNLEIYTLFCSSEVPRHKISDRQEHRIRTNQTKLLFSIIVVIMNPATRNYERLEVNFPSDYDSLTLLVEFSTLKQLRC